MDPVLDQIGSLGIVPMVDIDDPGDAPALMRALTAGGLPVAEFTFGTSAAAGAIRAALAAEPEALVGAGSVTTSQEVDVAIEAGARFVVSQSLDEDVVRRTRDRGIAVLPGCVGAADLARARSLGLEAVAFFSAEASGGIATLRALTAPFPGMRFVPAGDIDATSMDRYLAYRQVLAVGASWMVRPDLLRARDWATVTALTRDAVLATHRFSVAHVGLSTADASDAEAVARRLGAMFGFEVKVGNSSIFASPSIEVVKGRSRGELGHFAIRTASIPRAVAYFARMGFAVDPASEKLGADGSVKAVYLADEIAGFAFHLLAED